METTDSNSIKFSGHPDVETYLALLKIVRPQRTWSASGLVVVGLTVFAAIGILFKNGIPPLAGTILVLILVGMISLVPVYVKRRIQKHQKRGYTEAMQNLARTGSVSVQGMQIKVTDGQTELDWSYFDRAAEINGAIGLCKGRELVDAISRSMFDSDDAWNAAKKIVSGKVPTAKC